MQGGDFDCENCGYQPLVTWREAFYDVLTHPLSTFCFGLVAGGYLVFDAVIAAIQQVAQ